MRAPGFLQLARIDEQRFITACQHGLVHLTWERVTIRFSQEEFRRLAGMLEQAVDSLPPSFVQEGEWRITCRRDQEYEVQFGSLNLSLSPAEFHQLGQAAQEAVRRLDEILASGIWDRRQEDEAPPGVLEGFRRFSFSRN